MKHPATPRRILIVDDEAFVRETCEAILKEAGFATKSVASCAEALQVVEEQTADLLLLDVELPDEDGLTFLPRFKKLHPEVPVVILTGLGYDEAAMQSALRNGAQGFVSKHADVENMVATVRNLLRPADAASGT